VCGICLTLVTPEAAAEWRYLWRQEGYGGHIGTDPAGVPPSIRARGSEPAMCMPAACASLR
jgi:hypothetical protein